MENFCSNEIPAFAGMTGFTGRTDLQEGRIYRKDGLAGRTDLQEGRIYRKDGLTGMTDLQE